MTSSDLITLGGVFLAVGVGVLALPLSARQLSDEIWTLRSLSWAILEALRYQGWIDLQKDPATGSAFDEKGRLSGWHVPGLPAQNRAGISSITTGERRARMAVSPGLVLQRPLGGSRRGAHRCRCRSLTVPLLTDLLTGRASTPICRGRRS